MFILLFIVLCIAIVLPSAHAGGTRPIEVSIFTTDIKCIEADLDDSYIYGSNSLSDVSIFDTSNHEANKLLYGDNYEEESSEIVLASMPEENIFTKSYVLTHPEPVAGDHGGYSNLIEPEEHTETTDDIIDYYEKNGIYLEGFNEEVGHTGVVCWGDSLTNGTGGYGITYPDVLQQCIYDRLSGGDLETRPYDNVVNMGFSGEDAISIAAHTGSIRVLTTKKFTIPADDGRVEIEFRSASDKLTAFIHNTNVYINGVYGKLYSTNASRINKEDNIYYFKRDMEVEGEKYPVEVKKGTQIIFETALRYREFIPIIFIGQNGGYENVRELIAYQRAIINNQAVNHNKYIIVGLHSGTPEERKELESAMENEYGKHYINLREYMSTQALKDAGITPSEEDLNYMTKGMTPPSVLHGTVHFNEIGYSLVGKLIYKRMSELGFFDEIYGQGHGLSMVNEMIDKDYDYSCSLPLNKNGTIRIPSDNIDLLTDKRMIKIKFGSKYVLKNRMKKGNGYLTLHLFAKKAETTSCELYINGELDKKVRLVVL